MNDFDLYGHFDPLEPCDDYGRTTVLVCGAIFFFGVLVGSGATVLAGWLL